MFRRVHIRWMIRRDMEDVLRIEKESYIEPCSEDDFVIYLSKMSTIGMVCEYDEHIIGYMIYLLHKEYLEVIKLAVEQESRFLSVGRQMIDKLKNKLSSQRRSKVELTINESNLNAQLFLAKCGLRATKVIPNFYEDNSSAYIMNYEIEEETINHPVKVVENED